MEYFSKLNKFVVYPRENKLFSQEQFEIILDLIMFESFKMLVENGYLNNPSLREYLSCCFAFNGKSLVIGITDEKTIPGYTFCLSIKESSVIEKSIEETIEVIGSSGKIECGVNFKWFTNFRINQVFNKKTFWEDILNKESTTQVITILNNNKEYKTILGEIYKAAEVLANDIIVKERNRMNINPIFKARNLTVDDNMVFCVLPFNDERLEIFDEVLKPKLEKEFNLTVVRSGNIFEPNQNLPETIWNYINQAKFIIADISDKNANVFYELGICHTIGKPVISICDENSLKNDYDGKLPFDIGSINTIFYKNKGTGMEKLFENIKLNIQSIIEGKPIIR